MNTIGDSKIIVPSGSTLSVSEISDLLASYDRMYDNKSMTSNYYCDTGDIYSEHYTEYVLNMAIEEWHYDKPPGLYIGYMVDKECELCRSNCQNPNCGDCDDFIAEFNSIEQSLFDDIDYFFSFLDALKANHRCVTGEYDGWDVAYTDHDCYGVPESWSVSPQVVVFE